MKETVDGIALKTASDEMPIDPKRCIIRHGADHAVWSLLTDAQKDKLQNADKSTLAAPVPDFIFDDWKDLFSFRQLIPDEWFSDYLYKIIREILSKSDCSDAEILRETDSDEWAIPSADIKSRAVKAIFPVNMGSLSVSLTEASNREYAAI